MKNQNQNIAAIIDAYLEYVPMITIAKQYNLSRMGVWKILNKEGINTTKAVAANIHIKCDHCKKPVVQKRCVYRNRLHHFCSHKCFSDWLNRFDVNLPFISTRQGLRIGRKVISKYFFMSPGNVVHHIDRNENHNQPQNLMAFKSQAEHTRYHRGFNITPIWDGRAILEEAF
jgi:hypothetical protein